MIINHEDYIEDLEFLQKYALKRMSDECTLADQALILYFHKKDIPFPVFFKEPLMDIDPTLWYSLTNTEKAQFNKSKAKKLKEIGFESDDPIVNGLLAVSSLSGPANLAYPDICERLEGIPREEFCKEYPWLLMTLFEQSRLWVDNEYCSFEMTEKLKKYLESFDCEVELSGFHGLGCNCFVPAVFGGNNKDEDDAFTLLMRDALPDTYIFNPSEERWCERVQIESLDIPGAGWGVVRYPERYDGVDKIVYLSSKAGGIDSLLVRAWMENGDLWGVIGTYCHCDWSGTLGKIVILDLFNNDQSVHYLRPSADGIVEDETIGPPVPYESIALLGFSLNPSLYTKPENPHNLPLVSLGEICEIDNECRNRAQMGTRLPYYDYTTDFRRLCFNASHPRMDTYGSELVSALYEGPHVHISLMAGTAFVSHTSGVYQCQRVKSVALRVKDNLVSEEYLAYVLTRDISFCNFLLANPGEGLLTRKIAIQKDRTAQDKFVNRFKGFLDDDVLSSHYYKIIWIDASFDDKKTKELSDYLETKQVGVRWLKSVLDPENGLESVLEGNRGPIHAVVVDADVESVRGRLKGLRKVMALCKNAKIPVYVFTDVGQETISDDLQEEEFAYLSDGRIFDKNGAVYVGGLVAAIRRELDEANDITAEMRSLFRQELLAAEWLDEYLKQSGIHLVSDLSVSIMRPKDSLNIIRGILNSLYDVIIREIGNRSLEFLDRGALPSLLDDKSYRDGSCNRVFVIRGDVLPKTLARSLRLATDIANGASHKETTDESRGRLRVTDYFSTINSENIAWAVIRIVMDLVLYMRKVECRFDGHCEVFDPYKPELVEWEGVIRQSSKREYCCETDTGVRVRMEFDKLNPPEIDKMIRIKKLYREGKLVDLYQWYVKKEDWEYI